MYPEERHAAIAALVGGQGRVSVAEVASTFKVTTETVRRDLGQLERAGLLRRVYGGAVATTALTATEHGLAERDATRAAQKDRIAKAAADLLPVNGASMLLDAGTTTGRLAMLLPSDRRLVVITHAVPIATRLAGSPGVELHLIGGQVRGATQAAVGDDAVRALTELRVDVAFIGTNALLPSHGLSTPNADEAAVKRAIIRAARQVIALADSSKIGREYLVRFGATEAIDVLVTDDGIRDDDVRALEDRGVEVVVS